MSTTHFPHWPPGLPQHLTVPATNLWFNVEVSAARYPDKPFIVFYDTAISFAQFRDEAERIAGYLQADCGVKAGDRVLLYMQNSPQWVLGYYAILRANAVVVPVNPMNLAEELAHYVHDAGASVALVAQELLAQVEPLLAAPATAAAAGSPPAAGSPIAAGSPRAASAAGEAARLRHVIVATYGDCLREPTDLAVPPFVAVPRRPLDALEASGVVAWADVLAARRAPGPLTATADDLAVMPYTSGTTGHPKGCMHTHRNVMCTAVGGIQWFGRTQDSVSLSVLPFFHVTGMTGGMNSPMYIGATIVILPRWDRDAAAALIQRYRITTWQAISTMVIDFLANPRVGEYDLSTLSGLRGGGAAMPAAVAAKLRALTGLDYVEGYGMSETMSATHINPPHRPKPQCLGIPVFDVDARVVDPATFQTLPAGEVGEIVVHGPQVMLGYWGQAQASRDSFVEIDGKRFLRTGDLGRVDEDGYFFMTDRLKRMINASGFKVWPAEVEAMMYHHPAIQEVCVIAAQDARRGETVKAVVVLRSEHRGRVAEQDIVAWAHEHMAAYKSPRIVEFVDALPKSGTGKVQWRELQQREAARA